MEQSVGNKIRKGLIHAFYMGFSLVFLYLIMHILVNNTKYAYKEMILIPYVIIATAILIAGYIGFSRLEKQFFSEKSRKYMIVVAAFLAVYGILQLVFGNILRFTPVFDMGAIYDGAIDWVEKGAFDPHFSDDYFYYFPNNLGGLIFLKSIFSAAKLFGITDYFGVALTVNTLMCLAMMYLVISICKRKFGVRYAFLSMLLFALFFPLYFISAAFYTDALTILFPVLVYYLYLRSKDTDSIVKKLIYYALMGLAAGIGMEMKFTVVIIVVAIVIDSLLFNKIKESIIMTGISVAVIVIIFLINSIVMYGNYLDKKTADKMNTPYTHWVMMSMQGDGKYNPDDYTFTRSFKDISERNKKINEKIVERIKEQGPSGMLELFTRKSVICFGDGTLALSDFLDDTPKKESGLHKYVLYEGEKYSVYSHICEGVFLAIMFLMLVGGIQEVVSKEKQFEKYLAPRLAVFGILLFLCFWETSGRYITNYVPMIFLGAVFGIDSTKVALLGIGKHIKLRIKQ